MKKLLAIIFSILMICSISTMVVACKDDTNNTSQTQELTDEEKVRNAVTFSARGSYLGNSIGGNELKSSKAIITNLSWSYDKTKCTVSGRMEMRDIYDTVWNNNFDCVVTTSDNGETWKAGSFSYKSTYWSK